MFDLSDDSLTRVKKGSPEDRLETDMGEEAETPDNPLDSQEKQELHDKLVNYYRMELDRQSENRYQQALDEDYFDSIQYTENEIQELKDRGQPATVYNVIQQTVNWVTGAEKRGRTDFKVLPRGKEDSKPAEGKTKYLKYLSDVNRTQFHRSRAFEDSVKVGIGWLEEGVQDEDDGEPIYCRYESWRNVLFDSASTELDGSDMRYIFRSKWVDEDIAKALFPDRSAQIESAVVDSSLYSSFETDDGDLAMDQGEWDRGESGALGTVVTRSRRRVRLIEAWYRMPEKVKKIRGGAFSGQVFDETDPRHAEMLGTGKAILVEKVMMRTRVCIMTTGDLLWDGASPYRHNKFKFIPIWGYKRGRDGLPYGIIRSLRDIQDDVNKRMAKALHIISTNKVVMDEGALPDGTSIEDFAAEVSRPDAIIIKRAGKELVLNADRELEPAHLEFASRNIAMIQQVGGVTDELLGRATNATSGIAVQRRQEQGSLATSRFFDNLRLAEQMRGELELSLVEQFATEEKQFRITNQRGTPEFVTINDGLPENDITRTKADFVISEADWRATMREAATAELTELIAKMPPQVGMVILDLVVENMDIPNRDEIVKRIRAITGQRDPDASEPTPEEQAQQQAAAEGQAMQKAAAETAIRVEASKAAKAEAEAERIKAQTINEKMNATNTAMTAATSVVQMPTIAKIADNLLSEAGWNSFQQPAIQGLPPQQPMMPPEQQMQEQQMAEQAMLDQSQQTAPNQLPPEMAQPAEGGADPSMPA
jgi:hypothetical protein